MERIFAPVTSTVKIMTNLIKEDIGQPVITHLLDKDPKKKKYGFLVEVNEITKVAIVSFGSGKLLEYKYDEVEIDFYSASYVGQKPTLEILKRQIIKKSPPKKKTLVNF